MSLQASTTKYINNLRMSDPFFKIFDYSKDGKPVTLMLTHANGDSSESNKELSTFSVFVHSNDIQTDTKCVFIYVIGGYSKFTLSIREFNEKKILWNGSIPTNRIVAKLNQSDMGLTIENCLQNYVVRFHST